MNWLKSLLLENAAASWLGQNKTYKLILVGLLALGAMALDIPGFEGLDVGDDKSVYGFTLLLLGALRSTAQKLIDKGD